MKLNNAASKFESVEFGRENEFKYKYKSRFGKPKGRNGRVQCVLHLVKKNLQGRELKGSRDVS